MQQRRIVDAITLRPLGKNIMLKFFKSPLLWQITGGFVLGTIGMVALSPATASPLLALMPVVVSSAH